MDRSCPACGSPNVRGLEMAKHLRAASRIDYYLCHGCKHIWSVSHKTDEIIQHLTPLKPQELRKAR